MYGNNQYAREMNQAFPGQFYPEGTKVKRTRVKSKVFVTSTNPKKR